MNLDRRSHLQAFIVAALAIAVYANSLFNGFALDDVFIIEGNPRVHSPSGLGDIWLTPYWYASGIQLGLYRPGIIFLYAIEWFAGGGQAWVFHAVNVGLHAFASVLVFALLRRLASVPAALAGALLFAVHPVHTEAVANIVGQAEIVAAIAVLAACLVHSGRPEGLAVSWGRRLALIALFAVALTTKESAVVLPALLVLMDLAQRRIRATPRGFADYADAMLMPLFLLAATLALYLLIRFDVMGGALIGTDAAPSMPFLREDHRVLNALRAFPEFIRLLFVPLDLAADYSPAAILPVDTVRPLVVLGTLLLASLTVLSIATPWLPRAGFPAAWFLISIITVSNLFFPIGVVIAERTLYLPSVAVCALVAFMWDAAAPVLTPGRRRVALAAAVAILVAMSLRTVLRNPVWESTDTVWNSMLRDQPESYRTQWLAAIKLWRADRLDDAEARFELAYRLYARDSQLLTEYANLLMAKGRFTEALRLLEQADTMNPGLLRNLSTLMHAYVAVQRYEDAIDVAHEFRRTGGDALSALRVRAYAKQQLGDLDHAIAAWRVALQHGGPEDWRLHGHLARARAAAGYRAAALAGLDSARTALSDPASAQVLGTVRQAIQDGCYLRAAERLLPDSLPLPSNRPLGVECDQLGSLFEFTAAGQNASGLQNAMPAVPRRAPAAGANRS